MSTGLTRDTVLDTRQYDVSRTADLRRVGVWLGCALGGIVIAGFHETTAPVALTLVFSAAWFVPRARAVLFTLAAGLLLGFVLVALAPGNSVRGDALAAQGQSPIQALQSAMTAATQTAIETLFRAPVAVVLVFIVSRALLRIPTRQRALASMVVIVNGLLLSTLALLPIAYLTGYTSGRFLTLPTVILIGTTVILGAVWHDRR